ncbi:ensconsin isoform X3 [Pleurodeles waltl]|uniref:ensconsin isoform X3 n=1 Tax=Pleurodeles waltl TaxID=8319 RepID=UPI00370998D0
MPPLKPAPPPADVSCLTCARSRAGSLGRAVGRCTSGSATSRVRRPRPAGGAATLCWRAAATLTCVSSDSRARARGWHGAKAFLRRVTSPKTEMAERAQRAATLEPAAVPDLPCRAGGRDIERWRTSEGQHTKPHERRSVSLGRLSPAVLAQSNNNAVTKSELHPNLKVDDRQRLARERRVEREKQIAARESYWLEKEEKARQHYEKHLEERRKKLEEQRLKEERRRAAVDEKRKQRLEEEKERHEAVVRRTMERSQKPRQKPNRWSWGGALHTSTSINGSGYYFESSSFSFLDLAGLEHRFRAFDGARRTDPDRRSVSTFNLSKHVDPVITKRLSSSSATLMNTPDRARRLQLSPWETSVVSRLLTPTHSFLARSKSTAALSGDSASCSPISPQPYKTTSSRSGERPKLFVMASDTIGRSRTTHSPMNDKKDKDRQNEMTATLLNPTYNIKRSQSPSLPKAKSPATSPAWPSHKTSVPVPGTPKQIASPPITSKGSQGSQRPPSPGNVRPIKKDIVYDTDKIITENESAKDTTENTKTKGLLLSSSKSSLEPGLLEKEEHAQESAPTFPSPMPSALLPSPTSNKMSAGTNNPEEATRILTEKRRLAREQREREEQERREREEEERKKREEMAQKIAEERARREEEARKQEAERKQKEEEERREKEEQLLRLAEEKEQKEKDEITRLQKQKEEEEARQREEAERIRLEREKHFQKEEQERLERKKRLEEIMKRTRRSEGPDKQSNAQRNGEINRTAHETAPQPVESEQESPLKHATEYPQNGDSGPPSQMPISHHLTDSVDRLALLQLHGRGEDESKLLFSPGSCKVFASSHKNEKLPNENGVSMQNEDFEELINLPGGNKTSKVNAFSSDGSNIPDIPFSPILAFEETESLGPLAQVDNVQTQQTAEVI